MPASETAPAVSSATVSVSAVAVGAAFATTRIVAVVTSVLPSVAGLPSQLPSAVTRSATV